MAQQLPSSPSTPQLILQSCRVPPTHISEVDRPHPSIVPRARFPPIFHAAQIIPLLPSLCLLLELGRARLPARQPLTSNLKPLRAKWGAAHNHFKLHRTRRG